MKRGLVVLSLVGFVFAGVATASVQQGDTELDFLGGYLTQNGVDEAGDLDALFVSAALGYFFTDNIQGSVVGMGAWTEVDDEDTDVYGIGVRGKYHFMPTNQWVPYVGGQFLWAEGETDDEDADGTLWGPRVGLRYELNENNDFFVEYQYHVWEGDIGDVYDDGHGIFVGLIHQFK
jgi:predicted porin